MSQSATRRTWRCRCPRRCDSSSSRSAALGHRRDDVLGEEDALLHRVDPGADGVADAVGAQGVRGHLHAHPAHDGVGTVAGQPPERVVTAGHDDGPPGGQDGGPVQHAPVDRPGEADRGVPVAAQVAHRGDADPQVRGGVPGGPEHGELLALGVDLAHRVGPAGPPRCPRARWRWRARPRRPRRPRAGRQTRPSQTRVCRSSSAVLSRAGPARPARPAPRPPGAARGRPAR